MPVEYPEGRKFHDCKGGIHHSAMLEATELFGITAVFRGFLHFFTDCYFSTGGFCLSTNFL